jgi:hypothetical protein
VVIVIENAANQSWRLEMVRHIEGLPTEAARCLEQKVAPLKNYLNPHHVLLNFDY